MTKAVTLKNSSNEEVYPVTDISLVNGGIYADTLSTLEPTAGYISTAMLQNEAVTTAKLDDEAVTAAKLAGKAEAGQLSTGDASYNAASRGILLVMVQFQNYTTNTDDSAQISFSGVSGSTVTPKATQRSGIQYTRGNAFGIAFVDAGDNATWTVSYSNAGPISNGSFALFIPCNW